MLSLDQTLSSWKLTEIPFMGEELLTAWGMWPFLRISLYKYICCAFCSKQVITVTYKKLAETRPRLQRTIAGVIIVDEEAGGSRDDADIGVGRLMEEGELSFLRKGPVIWLDCADKQPNIGSGGTVQWKLTTNGKLFHSGFPHKGVNAVELAMDVCQSSAIIVFSSKRMTDCQRSSTTFLQKVSSP